MSLRTLIRKKKNAQAGLKYLGRKLAKLEETEGTDPELLKLVKGRLEKKQGRVEHWTTQVKEA